MSHCILRISILIKKSLPRRSIKIKLDKTINGSPNNKSAALRNSICNETPLCTCKKGSYTLEAAVIIPLVTAFLLFLLFFFRVMQVEYRVKEALIYAGRQTAVYSSDSTSGVISLALANGFFQKEITDDDLIDSYVKNGNLGIFLTQPDKEEDYLYLRASYRVVFPIGFFSLEGVGLTAETKNRIWSGSALAADASEDPIVYYTETGSVYHTTLSCSYLSLSIHMCSEEDIQEKRNKSGSIYTACEKCGSSKTNNGIVYITDYGTVYHTSINCSGLKRTIYTVKLSEVGNRKACSKCG